MRPWLMLRRADLVSQRPPGQVEDVHFTESLAAAIIGEYSREGDLVLDPFAGFGTAAFVASRMGRRCVAIEFLPERPRSSGSGSASPQTSSPATPGASMR